MTITVGIGAAVLCWEAVGWALGRDLFFYGDEIGNLGRVTDGRYRDLLHLLPRRVYNDRPLGFLYELFLFKLFGLHYSRQVVGFLVVHFVNCAMACVLFRRLGISLLLSIAAIGLFGSLSATMETATYIGAVFDVLCGCFLMAAFLAHLSERCGATIVSTILFVCALRTKEWAIVAPAALTVLVAYRVKGKSGLQYVSLVMRRLWPHYTIMVLFLVRYIMLGLLKDESPSEAPYHMQVTARTVLDSLAAYTNKAWQDALPLSPWMINVVLAVFLGYALVRRRGNLVFALVTYIVLLSPVSILPNIRAPLYVYVPQIFGIGAVCLLMEDMLMGIRLERVRRLARACTVVGLLCCAISVQHSAYFQNRLKFIITVRRACLQTSRDIATKLRGIGPESHVYVVFEKERPWLLLPGPCDYVKLALHRTIQCSLGTPQDQLDIAYSKDPTPEKYLVLYQDDGALAVQDKITW